MKIDEIERLWESQTPPAQQAAPAALTAQIRRELGHRRRLLAYLMATTVLCLGLMPTLFVVNALHQYGPLSPLRWASHVLSMGVSLTLLYRLYQALQRNRALRRRQGDTLHAVIHTALANVEAEMAEYRGAKWFVVASIFAAVLSVTANYLNGDYLGSPYMAPGWQSLALRFGLIALLVGGVGLVVYRHYRKNILPEYHRLQQTLAQLRD